MANLKEIRTRIASVTSTRQITSAMKMVSAAKFRKAQDAIVQLRPYANKLHMILSMLGDALKEDEENIFVSEKPQEKILLIVITSNRGLCGGFNSSVIKNTMKLISENYSAQARNNNISLLIIGKKAEDFFKKLNIKIIDTRNDLFDHLNYDNASAVARELIQKYTDGEFDRIEIIYNQFKNAAVQILTNEQFLPISIETSEEKKPGITGITNYIFEPSKEYLVRELIPKSLKLQFFKALLDSNASEHGARMTAMHKATDNATELLKDLKLEYNKARQASITNEILEIVSGANALEG